MKLDLNSFLDALSFSLDFIEIDYLGATTNHSKRVAYIAQRIALYFNMSTEERIDLFSCSILHDNGLCEDVLHTGILVETPSDKRILLEHYTIHCDIGEQNIKNYPFLTDTKNVIKYHHEHYDGSGFFGKSGDEIPLMAQIIALADTVDNLFHFDNTSLENRKLITEYITAHRGTHYSDKIVDAFLYINATESFWLDLQDTFIEDVLQKVNIHHSIDIELEDIYEISKVFSKIVYAKSGFTYRHTNDLIKKADIITDYYKFDREQKLKFMIAANLHDLGKLAIPNAIINKVDELTQEEFRILKSHAYCTGAALQKVEGFDDIGKWAANHHETLDGGGYPYGIGASELGFEERLLGCLDIYQALVEDRPYRKAYTHKEAMQIITKSVDTGKLDKNIVKDIDTVFMPLK